MALALSAAGQLKPEIRLAQAISEYEAILNDSQKAKFRTYRQNAPPDAADVIRLTAEIDRDGSRRSRQCVGPRLTNVLQTVQQFSTLVDLVIGGSQNLIAAAVWGVLKMSLQVCLIISVSQACRLVTERLTAGFWFRVMFRQNVHPFYEYWTHLSTASGNWPFVSQIITATEIHL